LLDSVVIVFEKDEKLLINILKKYGATIYSFNVRFRL